MTTQTDVHATLTELADLLERIPAEADGPTPCDDFPIPALRRHVVGWLTAFTDGFSRPDGACSDADAVAVAGDGSAQVRGLRDRLDAALTAGAGERPLSIGGSAMPGDLALAMILWEYQVHGWDLARAAGLPWNPDVDALAATLAFAPGMLSPDNQGEGMTFAAPVPVPEDAPPLDRLVGLSGRRPDWAA
ncbi:TIGR03086 family protein [Propioniciclava coleopterorum]|uniref:TIGR03086 family protein n=1 Tax=Propioniciclava coleopterorum TaxID=2714937 RepID=A0A6G7Y3Q1_9ACTN|nr:TIGR03086 family metal-binding protein [Propioniciclava coleopterorum]QIK71514.1 TIGR03086 family protein [Propioniciclava coleopterorum]